MKPVTGAIRMHKIVQIAAFIIMTAFFAAESYGQPCSKPTVSVNTDEILEKVYDHFQVQYPSDTDRPNMLPGFETWQTLDDWKGRVHDFLLSFMQECNPTIHFVSQGGDDDEYLFRYSLFLTAIEEYDPGADMPHTETAYLAIGTLVEAHKCGQNKILEVGFGSDTDLFQAIKNMIGFTFDQIDRRIAYQEQSHLSPPRGPNIIASIDKNYVSPLEDDRKINIKLEVRNCKKEVVYEKHRGHKVTLHHKADRTELRNDKSDEVARTLESGNPLLIAIHRPQTATIIYELKKGTQPDEDEVIISTCGRDRQESKKITLQIQGLEIKVQPKNAMIFTGEKVPIAIAFNRISANGSSRPVANKTLRLAIEGLEDGTISPSSKVTTDAAGKARLDYIAGKKDQHLVITAAYHPPGYPDSVQGKAEVDISSREWRGTLSIDTIRRFTCSHEPSKANGWREVRVHDERVQSANLTLGLDDFQLGQGNGAPSPASVDVSGHLYCLLSENHTTAGRPPRSECVSKGERRWVSPGHWQTEHQTLNGQAHRAVKKENLMLLFMREASLDVSQLEDLQQQMAEAVQSMDLDGIKNLRGKMKHQMAGDTEAGDIPIRIRVQLTCNPMEQVLRTRERQQFDVCLGQYKQNENNTTSIDMPLVQPIMVELKGFYKRSPDGRDSITADADLNEPRASGRTFGAGECPDIEFTTKAHLELERMPQSN